MDLLQAMLLGQPHPGNAPYLELTLERVLPDIHEASLPLTEANLAAHTGAPLPPQPWCPADAAVFKSAQYYLSTLPTELWRERVASPPPPSELSLLSTGELYTLEGFDSRRPSPLESQPHESLAWGHDHYPPSPIGSANPTSASSSSSDALDQSPAPFNINPRTDYPTPPTHSPSFESPPPPPRPLPSMPDPDLLEQLAELRARAQIAETRARYFEVALARMAVALETERARREHPRAVDGVGQDRRAKRACSPSKTCVSQSSPSPMDGAPAAPPCPASLPINLAIIGPRPEVVSRAWKFLLTHVDAQSCPAEARAGMARIRQLYPAAVAAPAAAAPVDLRPAKRPRGQE